MRNVCAEVCTGISDTFVPASYLMAVRLGTRYKINDFAFLSKGTSVCDGFRVRKEKVIKMKHKNCLHLGESSALSHLVRPS